MNTYSRLDTKVIFEKTVAGKRAWFLPSTQVPGSSITRNIKPRQLRRSSLNFPELAEIDVVRHYTNLSTHNLGVDTNFYPLGSCTMKYNPKINEDLASLSDFLEIHPLFPEKLAQGTLTILYELEQHLKEITGMDAFTLQPAAGAQGELTGLFILKKYLDSLGESNRTQILVPSSAHGTNPASASMAGFETITVHCNEAGLVDIDHLRSLLGPKTAGLMLTNPNTLGLFESSITMIADLVHGSGGLLYYDGANLNAIMGIIRPGDMGFDIMHLNLHKTFAAPHGGGGPGSGPVGVKNFLAKFLPYPVIHKIATGYFWDYDRPFSIGKIHGFYGNAAVAIKALLYIRSMGSEGLPQVSRDAVLNANYLQSKLKHYFTLPYNHYCMHEFVISAANFKPHHISALHIAKRLLDFGIHPPTIYFPLIVDEALMIEPTETESLETLDRFIEIMTEIYHEAIDSPEVVTTAPHHTFISKVDETLAARNPKLRWYPKIKNSSDIKGMEH